MFYDNNIKEAEIKGIRKINELSDFKTNCDLILTNRKSSYLDDVTDKVFTRDSFGSDL